MKVEKREISIREIFEGYKDSAELGVVAYGGKLDIRPPYQREFIYKDAQKEAVIQTIRRNYPLNIMYWADKGDGLYEVIDGQQRTLSICQYLKSDFSVKGLYFNNLKSDQQEQILNYKLSIYVCTGTDSEKLEWFKVINIAGEKLTEQELRNAVFSGAFITDAKRYFSKTSCAAYQIGSDYVAGTPIRQDYLETAIKWISENNIEDYMARHQHDVNALALWQYFQSVITWVRATFPNTRKKMMNGVEWGFLYNKFKDNMYDSNELEKKIKALIDDDEVGNQKGIYSYLLTGEEKYLSLRSFTDNMKRKVYEHQEGICPMCKNHFEIDQMEGDHINPWSTGGKTTEENCQMLCKPCNRKKSNI